jgi:hypothetical protein
VRYDEPGIDRALHVDADVKVRRDLAPAKLNGPDGGDDRPRAGAEGFEVEHDLGFHFVGFSVHRALAGFVGSFGA